MKPIFFCLCRYWVIAGPIYLCIAFLTAVLFYIAYNFTLTHPLDSMETVTGIQL